MSILNRTRCRSTWWFLLPILMQVLGGVIAYYALRQDDPVKAKNCLLLGVVMTAVGIATLVIPILLLMVFTVPVESTINIMPPESIFQNPNLEI